MMCRYQRNHPASPGELSGQECGLIDHINNVVHTRTRAAGRSRGGYRYPAIAFNVRVHDPINPGTYRLRRIIAQQAVVEVERHCQRS